MPTNWLTRQLAHADLGADVVVGTVRPDPLDLDERQLARWVRHTHPGPAERSCARGEPGHAGGRLRPGRWVPTTNRSTRTSTSCNASRHRSAVLVACDEGDVLTSGADGTYAPGGYARYLRTALSG